MPAILALVVANLPAILQSGQTVIDFVRRQRAALTQSGEWTDADEKVFADLLTAAGRSPAWQQDG